MTKDLYGSRAWAVEWHLNSGDSGREWIFGDVPHRLGVDLVAIAVAFGEKTRVCDVIQPVML